MEEDNQYDARQFGDSFVAMQLFNAHPQDNIAHEQTCKAHGEEDAETLCRLVAHFEIVGAVETETGGDAHQHRYAVCHQVVDADKPGESSEDEEIEGGGKTSDDAVKYQVSEFSIDGLDPFHIAGVYMSSCSTFSMMGAIS